MTSTKTNQQLPRIVRFDGVTEGSEFGDMTCPHCGALGRVVHHFLCEDGKRRGAMAGCIQLFPVSEIAREHKKITEKIRKLKPGRNPARWDSKKLDAIERYYQGKLTEGQCLAWIEDENRKRDDWMRSKGWR